MGIASDIFIIYQKDPRVEVFFMLVLACRKLVEFNNKTIYSLFSIVLIIEYDTIKIWKEYVKRRIAIEPI